jgi:hypothetical protein
MTCILDLLFFPLVTCNILSVVISHRDLGGETYARELFEEYIVRLKERFKEKERMREEEKVMLLFCVESFTISPLLSTVWFLLCYFYVMESCGK